MAGVLLLAMLGPHYFECRAYTYRCGIYSRPQRVGISLRCHIVDTRGSVCFTPTANTAILVFKYEPGSPSFVIVGQVVNRTKVRQTWTILNRKHVNEPA